MSRNEDDRDYDEGHDPFTDLMETGTPKDIFEHVMYSTLSNYELSGLMQRLAVIIGEQDERIERLEKRLKFRKEDQ